MSKFSRVKKNQDLYQDIIQDDSSEIIESSLRDYERRVSKDNSSNEEYVASRLKRNEQLVEQIEEVEPVQLQEAAKGDILSDRDLLSDFIEEVKHYNINKGLRSVQDTQTNILNNLSQGSTQERPQVESQSILELTSEIQQIIGDLDSMEAVDDIEVEDMEVPILKTLDHEEDEELASIFNEIETSSLSLEEILNSDKIEKVNPIQEVVQPKVQREPEVFSEKVEVELVEEEDYVEEKADFKANELLELTQTLSLKLDLQEKELEDVQAHSTIIDKILTGVIVLLVIAMVLIISYGIWWVYTERGF